MPTVGAPVLDPTLEIGCGNGHIVSLAAARIPSIRTAVFVDVNPHAITCTLRNLRANLALIRLQDQLGLEHCYGVTGPFNSNLPFGQQFDLVISNPPYIALRPGLTIGDARAASVAVTGTELLEEIVRSAQRLLTLNGRMLVMISSTSGDAVRRALPDGFTVSNGGIINKMTVPFDVEDVLDNPEWITWLADKGMVTKIGNEFFHELIPTWIQRSK